MAAVTTGCVVDVTPSGVGKPCPCDEGSICRGDTCVPAIGSCDPAIRLSESEADKFRAAWWTPQSIRWQWAAIGAPEDFGSYELFLGPTEASVAPGSTDARIFDKSTNPELAFLAPPDPSGAPVVNATTTDELEPRDPLVPEAGRYFARLEVRDKRGCPFTSPVVARDTERARVCPRIVFDETPIDGALPALATVEPGCGVDGSACLVCRASVGCLSPAESLFISLPHVDGLDSVTQSDFESGRAMLELSVAVGSTQPILFTEVGIATEDAEGVCGSEARWKVSDVFLRPATGIRAWQKLQIPLKALRDAAGAPPQHAQVIASTWCALHFRADPGGATEIRLDRVAGCW